MIDLFNRLFGRQNSSSTAKDRLRLVLLSDHLSLAPELVEDLKRELVDVISRYVEVDRSHIEINFEQQEKAVAMMANIPILSMHPPKNDPPKHSDSHGAGAALQAVLPGTASAPAAVEAPKKPRRRRKRSSATSNPAPAT